ncbi:hypothetical protein SAMN02745216_03493 [Desulfatibacillum alkenivorans DSM 16219]|jgi:hypothetical protein|uniref:Uncharacterized protein n=1 Tax=Desulfatibacillum alkenivorans DSM 16219 TaxID=1121393 RepID=A0A1M6SQ25_9BACT|nr:hypothetical protein [Desulfatibacillum alkenivorans]SHK46730.1 hypothetical protein SAMN02745216_03493 [Desulfatibacillum alkenivorans DSM 16219]
MDVTMFFMLLGMVVALGALIWFLVSVFMADSMHGLLTVLFPIFVIYVLMEHWDKVKRPFFFMAMVFTLIICIASVAWYQDADNCRADPSEVSVARLTQGDLPLNRNILISDHYRFYSECYYDYYEDLETGEIEVDCIYYQVLALDEATGEPLPPKIGARLIFGKTDIYTSLEDLPDDGVYDSLQGIFSFSDPDTRELVLEDFDSIHPSAVLIIDQGAWPLPRTRFIYSSLIAGCLSLLFLGLFGHSVYAYFKLKKRKKAYYESMAPPPLPPASPPLSSGPPPPPPNME